MNSKLRVLIVDDDEVHREMARRLIRGNYDIHDAETGDEALALAEQHRFDCVLLDNRLPDYTGLELLPLLRQRGLPVIMMTTLVTTDLASQAEALGCHRILQKDAMTPERLESIISSATQRS